MTTPTLLSVEQAAERLYVSRRTLYRLHADGKLRFVKVRGRTRIRESEIERYLRAAERAA